MAKAGYSIPAGADVALSAATAKSVIGVAAASSFGVDLKKLRCSFNGVTAADTPVLVQVCYATFATNAPGTASTSITPVQVYGRAITAGFTAARNWTTEPTVLTVLDEWDLTPCGGTVLYDLPLGDTFDSAVSEGFVVRCTAAAGVSWRGTLLVERC